MSKSRLTQHDVARHAGVSQAVVSYVLNDTGGGRITEATRNRVLSSIDVLGYVPHGVARGMRTGRSMLIGSVIPDITNPFYPAFQRGMQDLAETAGFSLVTFNSDGERGRERSSIRAALQCGVDGLIVSLFQTSSEELDLVLAQNIPLVVYGALAAQPATLPYDLLDIDIALATREVVTYLFEQGHRAIGLIDGPENLCRKRPRIPAYRAALSERGLPPNEQLIVHAEFSEMGGYEAMNQILEHGPRPTSVIAANDIIAMGILAKIDEVGLSVPNDIAVVGYDDIPAARLLRPALTTVALHPGRIGARAVELLLDRLRGTVSGEGRSVFMPHSLVIRTSA